MSNVLDFDKFKGQIHETRDAKVKKKYQNIVEDLVSSMMDAGIEFDDRTEKAVVPLLKILENILYTQHGMDHRYTKEVNRFIDEAFNKKIQ
tara:strand:+ start:1894 stop:2166 length:273 start_codon:yes stop_codon:yes gene_type:complete